ETVRWLHQRTEVADARQALRSEIEDNLTAARYTVEHERCQVALWERYAAWAKGGPHPPMATDVTGFLTGNTTIWEVVKTGAVADMPLDERLSYAKHYAGVELDIRNVALEAPAVQRVFGQGAKAALTPADAARLLEDARAARGIGMVRSKNALFRIER